MPRLGKVIARGGNGVVRVLADDDAVVCKELARTRGDGPPRFIREVTVLQAIDHPGVIKVLDSNVSTATRDEVLWFTMPRAKPFPDQATTTLPERVALLAQIASTLADLAAVGIHHRDIKPSNLLMLADRPLIADFGLVTTPEDVGDLTARRNKLGSNFYIPSELINDPAAAADEPADVYSLGKTIWVVLSGRSLPPNQVDGAAALAVLLPTEPRLSELDSLLRVMTAEDPSGRPLMAVVARELAAWTSAERGDRANDWPDVRAVIDSVMLHQNAAGAELVARKVEAEEVRSGVDRLASRCEEVLQFLEDQGAPVFRRDGPRAFQYDGGDLLDMVSKSSPILAGSDESPEIRRCLSSLVGHSEGQPGLRHFVGVVKSKGELEAVYVVGAAITYWGGPTEVLQAGVRSALIGGPGEAVVFDELSYAMRDRVESDVHAWREATINSQKT